MKNNYSVVGDVVEIEMNTRTNGTFKVKVSVEDFDIVNSIKGRWHCHYTKSGVYAKATHEDSITKDGKVFMHRLLCGGHDKDVVDHINRDTLDNTRENLRRVNRSVNGMNRKVNSNNSSGLSNVRYHKQAKKWQAYIREGDKFVSLGLHACKESASEAVNAYKNSCHYDVTFDL